MKEQTNPSEKKDDKGRKVASVIIKSAVAFLGLALIGDKVKDVIDKKRKK